MSEEKNGKAGAYSNVADFLAEASVLNTSYIEAKKLGLKNGVWVRELTAAQRDKIMQRGGRIVMHEDGSTEIDLSQTRAGTDAVLAGFALVTDESGTERMFQRVEDPRLAKLSSRVLSVIVKEVRKLSGMTKESREGVKKDEETSPNGSSGLALQES